MITNDLAFSQNSNILQPLTMLTLQISEFLVFKEVRQFSDKFGQSISKLAKTYNFLQKPS